MHTLVFDQHRISLAYENNTLIVRHNDSMPRTIPLTHIRKIICLHSVQLTTQLLGQLWERGICFVHLNNRYTERSFAIHPPQNKQVARRCIQYQWQQDHQQSLSIAKSICRHRLSNNLKIIDDLPVQQAIQQAYSNMETCSTHNQLRGVEGAIQRQVFDYWRSHLPSELGFTKRQKRPARDPVNALLSLTYTLVHQEAVRQCIAAGLDPQLGFYHAVQFGRDSLACDIMEPIRPYCELWVFQQFKHTNITPQHFTQPNTAQGAYYLNKTGRALFYQSIDQELMTWQNKLKAHARWLSQKIDHQLRQGEHYA